MIMNEIDRPDRESRRVADTESRIQPTDIPLRNFPSILQLSFLPLIPNNARFSPTRRAALLEENKYRGRVTAVAAKQKASPAYYYVR